MSRGGRGSACSRWVCVTATRSDRPGRPASREPCPSASCGGPARVHRSPISAARGWTPSGLPSALCSCVFLARLRVLKLKTQSHALSPWLGPRLKPSNTRAVWFGASDLAARNLCPLAEKGAASLSGQLRGPRTVLPLEPWAQYLSHGRCSARAAAPPTHGAVRAPACQAPPAPRVARRAWRSRRGAPVCKHRVRCWARGREDAGRCRPPGEGRSRRSECVSDSLASAVSEGEGERVLDGRRAGSCMRSR